MCCSWEFYISIILFLRESFHQCIDRLQAFVSFDFSPFLLDPTFPCRYLCSFTAKLQGVIFACSLLAHVPCILQPLMNQPPLSLPHRNCGIKTKGHFYVFILFNLLANRTQLTTPSFLRNAAFVASKATFSAFPPTSYLHGFSFTGSSCTQL